MRITIRLYKRYDLDLIDLKYNPYVSLPKIIKECIRNYIRTQGWVKITVPDYNYQGDYKNEKIDLLLNENEDKDILQWINAIPSGIRNSALKNVIRACLTAPNLYPYFRYYSQDKTPETGCERTSEHIEVVTNEQKTIESKTKKIDTKEKPSPITLNKTTNVATPSDDVWDALEQMNFNF